MRIILLSVLLLSGCATSPYVPELSCKQAANAPRYQQELIDSYLWGAIETWPVVQRKDFLIRVLLECQAYPDRTLGEVLETARRNGPTIKTEDVRRREAL